MFWPDFGLFQGLAFLKFRVNFRAKHEAWLVSGQAWSALASLGLGPKPNSFGSGLSRMANPGHMDRGFGPNLRFGSEKY